jgi:hypothetical protein
VLVAVVVAATVLVAVDSGELPAGKQTLPHGYSSQGLPGRKGARQFSRGRA